MTKDLSDLKCWDLARVFLNWVLTNFKGIKMSKKTSHRVLDIQRTVSHLTFPPWLFFLTTWLAAFLRTWYLFGIYLRAHIYLTQNVTLPRSAFCLHRRNARRSADCHLGPARMHPAWSGSPQVTAKEGTPAPWQDSLARGMLTGKAKGENLKLGITYVRRWSLIVHFPHKQIRLFMILIF